MRALITGGAGFVGSHLTERLLRDGHRVDVIDDLSTGNRLNMARSIDSPNFSFVNGSVLNERLMYGLIEKCDIVFHLAAAVGVKLIVEQPVHTIMTNIRGTEVVLQIAKEYGRKVMIASTSEIYGKNTKVPFQEDDDRLMGSTTFSRWSYACSKAVDEFLGLAYHRQYELPVLITRFFNTVGERQTGQYGMVIPRFVEAALRGKPLTVYGDGLQSRCFAYVGDVIDGVLALVEESTAYGQAYNIGATEEITIKDLALKIKRMTESPSEIRYIPYEQVYGEGFDDMRRRVPSIDKISKKVGYKPKTSLDETLEKIIQYFKKEVLTALPAGTGSVLGESSPAEQSNV